MGAAGVGMAALSSFGGIMGGIQAKKEADAQSSEIMNQTVAEAGIAREEAQKFRSQQEVAFLKSGVILDGSPLLVLEETRTKGIANVKNIQASGKSRATAVAREGRARLIGSLFGGAGTMTQGLSSFGMPKGSGSTGGAPSGSNTQMAGGRGQFMTDTV